MLRISNDVLITIFEESFDDEVCDVQNRILSTSLNGYEYSMDYSFLDGYITFHHEANNCKRIGTIFLDECNIFSEVDPSSPFGYCVGFFELKLKKFIKSNQKKSRRKFLMR
jgi:hypothetical protein